MVIRRIIITSSEIGTHDWFLFWLVTVESDERILCCWMRAREAGSTRLIGYECKNRF